MLNHVFSPITINGMELKNRMVVTPMVTDYCNDDGTATEKYLAYHEEKAKGGFGLIITEDYNIAPNGHGFKATAGFWNDGQIESIAHFRPEYISMGQKSLHRSIIAADRPIQEQFRDRQRGPHQKLPVLSVI
ncbi:MAG: hypothetical protein IJH71_10385 [Eubacterium sp.]|nr:hypothetical protein [Eubacterium sp.]